MVCVRACMQERLGLAAEHGYFLRYQASQEWENQSGGHADLGWKDMVIPILEVCHSSRSVACHFLLLLLSLSSVMAWQAAPVGSHGPEPDLLPVRS